MFRKLINVAFPPDAGAMARRELLEARLSLLEAQSGLEFSTAMVEYHTKRVARLDAFTGESA